MSVFRAIITCIEDKNPANDKSVTPLHIAARDGYPEICKTILNCVEEVHPRDSEGETPLDKAKMYCDVNEGCLEIVRLFER